MKRLITMMVITIAIFNGGINASAQNAEQQRLSREQLAEKQAKHIAHELALDEATTQKYVNTYCACQKEIWALGPRLGRHQHTATTEAESEKAIKDRFDRSEKILKIREKYYHEYSKFLTQVQIERAYKLEQQSMRRLAKHRQDGQGKRGHRKQRGKR